VSSGESPRFDALARITVAGDELLFGGLPLGEIARRAGRTPFYAYDGARISRDVARLRSLLPADVKLHYAIKANPMPEVVAHLARLVDGLDVASAGELRLALATAVDRRNISFAGPGKTEDEIEAALEAGIVLNLESPRELRVLATAARRRGKRASVAIRVNPTFELKSSGMSMGGGPKQFGIDAEQVPELLKELADLPLDFLGFHLFSGSQSLRADAICEAQENAVRLAIELARAAPAPVRLLNIGGGFGIPYFAGESALDVATIGARLERLAGLVRRELPEAELVLELGRYLVGEAGIYVCRVIDRKLSRGHVFLVTDGGLHHHLAASGNFGQVLRKNYPVLVGNRVRGAERERASVVGPLCTPLDVLADSAELARADAGDLIVVLQSGAYGFSASPHGFLSHPPPAEIFLPPS
jgi:diaminopimelate decarboxylase